MILAAVISIFFALAVLSGCASTDVPANTIGGPGARPPQSNLGLRLHRRPDQAPQMPL
jgi:hypothetical protein